VIDYCLDRNYKGFKVTFEHDLCPIVDSTSRKATLICKRMSMLNVTCINSSLNFLLSKNEKY